jgi:TetR/AcrR family transcriptional regulator
MAPSSRDRILDAAEARFAERGFRATSIGEIADDVGIRGPSLYKHFATKADLYHAVARRLLDPYFELLEALLVPPTDAAIAQQNLETVARHYYETPNLARLVQHAALAGGPELDVLTREWFHPFLRRAAQLTTRVPALGDGDRQRAAFVVMAFHSILSGYVTMAPLHRKLLGEDPLGKRAREHHLAFLRSLAGALWAT